MTWQSSFDLIAAAVETSEVFDDGGSDQWLTDILGAALIGVFFLPFVLFFTWVLHRLRLDRWILATAALATILTLVATFFLEITFPGIFNFTDDALRMIGVHRFMYMATPTFLVWFFGAMGFGLWLRRHRRKDMTTVFE